ncbi:hypothetical protein BRUCa_2424 [Brucella melitensis]|nr:hypothetical protein BM28_B0259 [Brucella melitensis M28]ADZ88375.1 hypothetical protein BM590_B0258 [Brucella melitensis M5-90]AEW15690.1 hypothetical protein BCA52141_II0814 [Brucella canis HSK A52141]AEW19611.1 hypothetical protein BAA13334_II01669 [Brucella abortus A13334]AIB18929.1 Hypothetical protein BSSP3_II0235 [Brucella suis bv. 2]
MLCTFKADTGGSTRYSCNSSIEILSHFSVLTSLGCGDELSYGSA